MKKIKTYEDYLNYVNGNFPQNKSKGKFGFSTKIKRLIAFALIATLGFGASCNKKEKNNSDTNIDTTSISNTIDPTSLSDLGAELSFNTTEEKKEYGQTTGNVDTSKIVKNSNGKIYANKEAKNNSSKVGTTVIDTKNDTLEVKDNGKVYQKEEEYEIVKDGEVIASGTITENAQTTPSGEIIPDEKYEYNEEIDSIIEKEDTAKVEKYDTVILENDFYDENGNLVRSKGDIVTKENYENLVNNYLTTKPTIPTTENKEEITEEEIQEDVVIEETVESVVTQGITNSDGTYTVDGLTFESKADYDQWIIQGFTGYFMDADGLMKSEEVLIQSNTLTK